MIRHVAGLAKRLHEIRRRLAIILDDQNPHGGHGSAKQKQTAGRTWRVSDLPQVTAVDLSEITGTDPSFPSYRSVMSFGLTRACFGFPVRSQNHHFLLTRCLPDGKAHKEDCGRGAPEAERGRLSLG